MAVLDHVPEGWKVVGGCTNAPAGYRFMTNIQAINLLKGLEQSLDDYCELNDEGKTAFRMAITALELFGNSEPLPSAQPEIIRCCKCVYWQQYTVRQNSNDAGWWNEALCEKHTIYGNEPREAWVDADWYCADAERRTDE